MTELDVLAFDIAQKTLCVCCKNDVDEVEAVIAIVSPQLAGFWSEVVQEAVELAELELRFGTDTDVVLAIVINLVLERVRFTLPDRLAGAIEGAFASVIGAAGRELGLGPQRGIQARLLPIARADLETLVRGRVDIRLPVIRSELEALAGAVRGSLLGPDPQDVPAAVRTLRNGLTRALGGGTANWVRPTVDLWGYRWFNLGTFALGRAAGVVAWEAVAVRDRATTRFCEWVDRRIISVEKLERQFDRFTNAVLRGDGEASRAAWPLLEDPNAGNESTWEAFFAREEVGFSPYHFGCRTQPRPVRIPR